MGSSEASAGHGAPADLLPARTSTVWAGVAGPVVFVLSFTVDGWTRQGYDPMSTFVSELSIGAGGWVQKANFLVSGSLFIVFAHAVARAVGGGRGAKAAPVIFALLGACLAASAFFTTDPSAMFNQVTVHGRVHGVLGAVVFLCMPISCFVLAARLAGVPTRRRLRSWTVVVGVALVALTVLLKISELPSTPLWEWRGLVQRILLVTYMAWAFALAVQLLRQVRRPRVAALSASRRA